MKVSKEKLKAMIKEELEKVMKEGDLEEIKGPAGLGLEESEELDEVKAHGGAEEKEEHKGETKAEKEKHEKGESAAEEKAEHDKKKMEEAQVEELRESFRRFTKLPKNTLKG
jgi:hypothetical protein